MSEGAAVRIATDAAPDGLTPAGRGGMLAGVEVQPHVAAVLAPALPPDGSPSHAYLFHGLAGSGRAAVARAFASELICDGAPDRAEAAERVLRGVHPDLTWVRPTGAAEMLVADIEEPVVAAVSHTPFEARRRVFVIEGADTMGERAANMLLKTLEEPPSFAHLILLAERVEDVMPTVRSRCLPIRFEAPPPQRIEQRLIAAASAADRDTAGSPPLELAAADRDTAGSPPPALAAADRGTTGSTPPALAAAARLCLGDMRIATMLAGEDGMALRAAAETLADAALTEVSARPWSSLLDAAGRSGAAAGERVAEQLRADLDLLPSRERKRREREGAEAARRAERRARIAALDVGLMLLELWLRDMLCIAEGAPELIHAVDRRERLSECARGRRPGTLRTAVDLVCATRLSLARNVSEELAIEAMLYRLADLLAG